MNTYVAYACSPGQAHFRSRVAMMSAIRVLASFRSDAVAGSVIRSEFRCEIGHSTPTEGALKCLPGVPGGMPSQSSFR
jgi:hypothetical protein